MTGNDLPHITLLCARYWPEQHGGVESQMGHVSRAFARMGCSVSVFTENRVAAPPFEEIEPGLTVRRFDPLNAGSLWRWSYPLRIRWWVKAIRHAAPRGYIWATDPLMALATVIAGRKTDLVYNPAGCTAAMNLVARRHPHVTTMRTAYTLRGLDRLAYRLAPRVVVGAHNLRQQFETHFGPHKNINVVPHGVAIPSSLPSHEKARHQRRFAEDDFVIGFVGRLDPTKDLGFLFEALSSRPFDHQVKLLIVGDGPDKLRLDKLAAERDLTDRIVWAGHCQDPNNAYAAMDVMVLPSVYEAFGNVVPEAMVAGVPVIGRRRDPDPRRPVLTASEELIRHGQTGLLVDPHDPADLARQLAVLQMFPGGCQAMGRQARRHAMARLWTVVVSDYLSMLGHLPAEHRLRNAA